MKVNTKKISRWIFSLLLFVGLICLFMFAPTWTNPDPNYENGIYELKKVMINDAFHQVMIRGSSPSNPIILFVSDGFDSTLSYTRTYEVTLEQYVTMVHFDLRGTGRSELGKWGDGESYISMLIKDVLQLTTYLQREFKVDQVMLVGHGTGSLIARDAFYQSPEMYFAYIGISQIDDLFKNDICVIEQLKQLDNVSKRLLAIEESIKKRENFIDRKLIEQIKPNALQWNQTLNAWRSLLFSSESNGWNFLMAKSKESKAQELFYQTYLNEYGSLKNNEPAKNNESNTDTKQVIDVPMYFVSGRYDYIVPKQASLDYFEGLTVSKKKWVEFTSSAHYPHIEEEKQFMELIREIIKEHINLVTINE